jgi:hypothetical protein
LMPLLDGLLLAGPARLAATRRLAPIASMATENHVRLCTIALLSSLEPARTPARGCEALPLID